ncbi:MAG TPA: hypothetical protein DEA05_10195 [Rhodobacteraceae bacterium]|nr:hypothetical protein [Paracoccaceae bacterium]
MAGLVLGLLAGLSGAENARAQDVDEGMALVSQKGFECFIRHLGSYIAQGQEITVDFEGCPSQPGLIQRMEAREATNLLPMAGAVRDAAAGPSYRKYMILTPGLAECLRRHQSDVLKAAQNGLVPLIPADCRR